MPFFVFLSHNILPVIDSFISKSQLDTRLSNRLIPMRPSQPWQIYLTYITTLDSSLRHTTQPASKRDNQPSNQHNQPCAAAPHHIASSSRSLRRPSAHDERTANARMFTLFQSERTHTLTRRRTLLQQFNDRRWTLTLNFIAHVAHVYLRFMRACGTAMDLCGFV